MGHGEMLLAVAGLDDKAIQARTRKLAEGDWSGFPPAQRAAFAYARKMSKEPWSITDEDITQLQRVFGPERALDVIWWAWWIGSAPVALESNQASSLQSNRGVRVGEAGLCALHRDRLEGRRSGAPAEGARSARSHSAAHGRDQGVRATELMSRAMVHARFYRTCRPHFHPHTMLASIEIWTARRNTNFVSKKSSLGVVYPLLG